MRKTLPLLLWLFALLSTAFVISASIWVGRARPTEDEAAPVHRVPAFTLTDQTGQPFGTDQLAGHVWIANFIFTRCQGPCPELTRKLASLQRTLPDSAVRLVTVSVDPEHDTPDVLRDYAARYGADEKRWRFLTGPLPRVHQLAAAMNIGIQPATDTSPILHSTYFVLVDASGQIRGYYSGQDDFRLKDLIADAKRLAPKKSLARR